MTGWWVHSGEGPGLSLRGVVLLPEGMVAMQVAFICLPAAGHVNPTLPVVAVTSQLHETDQAPTEFSSTSVT